MARIWAVTVSVAGVLGLAACGGGSGDSALDEDLGCTDSPEAPTTTIGFEVRAEEPSDELTADAAAVVCARLEALGVPALVEPAGSRIEVTMSALDPDAVLAERVSAPARLSIYDWEDSLLEERGFGSERDATRFAAKRGEEAIVVRDPGEDEFYVLRDEPALTGADITGAKQGFDPETEGPSIGLGFTEEGATKFEELTGAVAERGGSFAIVVDGEVLARPVVDAASSPGGLDADEGVLIAGGLGVDEARTLAAFLETDGLPQGAELIPDESG